MTCDNLRGIVNLDTEVVVKKGSTKEDPTVVSLRQVLLFKFKLSDWHIPLVTDLPGWWALLEMFRLDGPNILTGLDTILIGDLDPLLQKAEACPADVLYGVRDFYYPKHWATGVTLWNGDWSALLEQHTAEDRRRFRGDQNYIEDALLTGKVPGRLGYLQDDMPFKHIISFKADITRYNRKEPCPQWSPRVCCFHGWPRPWDIADDFPWVKEALTLPQHEPTNT